MRWERERERVAGSMFRFQILPWKADSFPHAESSPPQALYRPFPTEPERQHPPLTESSEARRSLASSPRLTGGISPRALLAVRSCRLVNPRGGRSLPTNRHSSRRTLFFFSIGPASSTPLSSSCRSTGLPSLLFHIKKINKK